MIKIAKRYMVGIALIFFTQALLIVLKIFGVISADWVIVTVALWAGTALIVGFSVGIVLIPKIEAIMRKKL